MQYEEIIAMVKEVSKLGLTSFEFTEGNIHISMNFPASGAEGADIKSQGTPRELPASLEEKSEPEWTPVKSPLVGTFYAAPDEDSKPYVSVGDRVKKGQTLGIVEAMKLMNEIESEYDGVVKQILVENQAPVEYGQILFYISEE